MKIQNLTRPAAVLVLLLVTGSSGLANEDEFARFREDAKHYEAALQQIVEAWKGVAKLDRQHEDAVKKSVENRSSGVADQRHLAEMLIRLTRNLQEFSSLETDFEAADRKFEKSCRRFSNFVTTCSQVRERQAGEALQEIHSLTEDAGSHSGLEQTRFTLKLRQVQEKFLLYSEAAICDREFADALRIWHLRTKFRFRASFIRARCHLAMLPELVKLLRDSPQELADVAFEWIENARELYTDNNLSIPRLSDLPCCSRDQPRIIGPSTLLLDLRMKKFDQGTFRDKTCRQLPFYSWVVRSPAASNAEAE